MTTSNEWLSVIKVAAGAAVVLGSYVSGHVQAVENSSELHQAEGQGIARASQAVRDAIRLELAPLRRDIQNLNGAVDTLWAGAIVTNRRLEAIELPQSATATASSWRQQVARP